MNKQKRPKSIFKKIPFGLKIVSPNRTAESFVVTYVKSLGSSPETFTNNLSLNDRDYFHTY